MTRKYKSIAFSVHESVWTSSDAEGMGKTGKKCDGNARALLQIVVVVA